MLLKSAFFYVFHNSSPHCSDVVIPVLEGRYLRILSIFCRGREEVIYFYKLITSCGGHRSKWGQQPGALLYGALGSDALALMMQSNTRFGVGSDIMSVLCTWTLWLPSSTGVCSAMILLTMLVWQREKEPNNLPEPLPPQIILIYLSSPYL